MPLAPNFLFSFGRVARYAPSRKATPYGTKPTARCPESIASNFIGPTYTGAYLIYGISHVHSGYKGRAWHAERGARLCRTGRSWHLVFE